MTATLPEGEVPDLSIMLTIVDGGAVLERCLEALAAQQGGHRLEVLVPWDHMSREAADFAARFPEFRFLDLGTPFGGKVPRNALEMHRFYDRRRAEALKVARGRLIGIIEDRGIPAPDWAATMIALHDAEPGTGVIGGAVENGVDRPRNWAIFFCDFGRYQPPLAEENPEYVTDTNIVYKREALLSVRHLWEEQYQEAQVNWALRRAGVRMRLTDGARTIQLRPPVPLGQLLAERVHWARMFGQVRARELGRGARLRLALAIPALPVLLFLRHWRRQRAKGRHLRDFMVAAPTTFLLLVFWAIGEFIGNLEGATAPDGH